MIEFSDKQINGYLNNLAINGTGYLAYRDILPLCLINNIDLSNVLDLGCGNGRSTIYLNSFCRSVSGTDISKNLLDAAKSKLNANFFINDLSAKKYGRSQYTAVFSILMFFHLTTLQEINRELMRCFRSLKKGGHLVVVSGTSNLYTRQYSTVKNCGTLPKKSGVIRKIYLSKIDTFVEDCYWSETDLINLAHECDFELRSLHYPVGKLEDKQDYLDEFVYPPYFYLIFQRKS